MSDDDLKKWQTNSSEYLVNDRWLKLRADSCTTPDGRSITPFYVFEYSDWVNCMVIDDNYEAVVVRHYRHGIDEYITELVGGGLEATDGSPEDGARRELEEELGYVGGEIYRTGVSYPNPANQTNKVYSFLAVGGSCKQKQKLEDGESLRIIKLPLKDFIAAIEDKNSDAIYQSIHLATVFFMLNFIKGSSSEAAQKLRALI